ncbi:MULTISPECIES: AAA family ATPase [Nostoc]|uniref:AAA family ATPase n=1 Tax=Nostoc paludosum FACHB-159 TaxID=2692908 RepID=A0ABR8K9B5_9NOSO|nr:MULTISPECIES: AAA family ATPase [Nostoc]MBD2679041.1 AAA family ATPase [Nostoc sp. FACHB-857]MBD2735419.1 AAA family ATPase [Nostoc paludosum FACHB-159]
MVAIAGYQITDQIYQSSNSLVYRGYREQDNKRVILKILREEYPTLAQLTRYKQEYEITHNFNLERIVKAYTLEHYHNTLVIIFEDFGGQSLRMLLEQQQFTLPEVLKIALKITESLRDIHKYNIIHKDINPSNIVFNPDTQELKLIDFGISSVLNQENPTLNHPSVLEGTLAYMSPEQTGRMNRSLDYRSDFYSLGVTIYELLTCHLPFNTNDPLELIHCHLAKQPIAPHLMIGEENCPKIISNIVMKLMSKTAEERYQSAWGIITDLSQCLNQLESQGEISAFSLGSQDIIDKFQISQKLYGREQEIEALEATFERIFKVDNNSNQKINNSKLSTSKFHLEMMLVSGYSGIGKSALIKEIYKPITQSRGYFIYGKFDQYQRNIPYFAVLQAFSDLVKQLLTETETQLQAWRDKFIKALGANAQIIIDVIPEIELIIGQQPAVTDLSPVESQNRFNLVLQNFIRIFTQPEHPLVIFLDDLQWADTASLKLIQLLMNPSERQCLFLIGTYRDNEVSAAHPLMLAVEQIKQLGSIINEIYLSALDLASVNQLIADTLKTSVELTKPLAKLVLKKTGGNPFFIKEFLKSLYDDGLLHFHPQTLSWQWNIKQIEAQEITDNVVDLMSQKIKKLPRASQKILKLAAVIGNQFSIYTLAIASAKSPREIALSLHQAISEELILPKGNIYKSLELDVLSTEYKIIVEYQFAHDRIQQAAYSLMTEQEKLKLPQQVGQLLLTNTPTEQIEEKIFDIVNQLNFGIPLRKSQAKKNELAQLNLIAGRKAKAAAAYTSALNYLKIGIELLPKSCWQTQYNLSLDLHETAAEVAYLSGDFQQAEQIIQLVLTHAQTLLDKIKVYQVSLEMYKAQNRSLDAIAKGRQALSLLGIELPEQPNLEEVGIALQEVQSSLVGREIEELIDLPDMNDAVYLTAMNILGRLQPITYVTNPLLFAIVVLKQVRLSLTFGNCAMSALGYGTYAIILWSFSQDIKSTYGFGQLALNVLAKYQSKTLAPIVIYAVNNFTRHWQEHLKATLRSLQETYSLGLETGDLEQAAYSLWMYSEHAFWLGTPLLELEQTISNYYLEAVKLKQEIPLQLLTMLGQLVSNLLGYSENPLSLKGDLYNEQIMLPIHQQGSNTQAIFNLKLQKLFLDYLFEDYNQAWQYSEEIKQYIDAVPAKFVVAVFYFYDSLARLAVYTQVDTSEQEKILYQVAENQQIMQQWANYAPMNFLHKFYLVEAERHRVLNQFAEAMDDYDRAIELAHEQEYIHEEALAYELAAKFYLAKGNNKVAETYMKEARYCYVKWGAIAKVKVIEQQYPQIIITIPKQLTSSPLETNPKRTITNTTETSQENLDLHTLIKTSKALSQEKDLQSLLKILMQFVLENAGAEKGFLLWLTSEKLTIEAEASLDSEIQTMRSLTLQESDRLSKTIINYVYRTQETIVLKDAGNEELFATDNYIVNNRIKSVLCLPILSQSKLIGILYLENNLIINAFNEERLEVLKLICSQAAISIENALLRKIEQEQVFEYQVGGCLTTDSLSYIVRQADQDIYKGLKLGEFCYVLNSRHMGKSSLRVKIMQQLQKEQFACAAIDLTSIGSQNITIEQWYAGLIYTLVNTFKLTEFNFRNWWRTFDFLSPVQRFSEFIKEVLLKEIKSKIVIFIDEIDSVISLNFPMDDFFAMIRSCYNNRADYPEYKRLSFVLLGVASPSSLIQDKNRTPFNIGRAITLKGFQLHEIQPLVKGLTSLHSNPQILLAEVLAWTGGQPFLTQKICSLVFHSQKPITEGKEAEWVNDLIVSEVIENWESKDDPEHLKNIRNRLLRSASSTKHLLKIYREILQRGEIAGDDSPEQTELILSGLVSKEDGKLKVYNRIYETVFDITWVEKQLANFD